MMLPPGDLKIRAAPVMPPPSYVGGGGGATASPASAPPVVPPPESAKGLYALESPGSPGAPESPAGGVEESSVVGIEESPVGGVEESPGVLSGLDEPLLLQPMAPANARNIPSFTYSITHLTFL
jgi:hypothetical protein